MDKKPLIFIIISALLFGISPPLAKLLLAEVHPIVMAGLLYLGAFSGLSLYSLLRNKKITNKNSKYGQLEKKDFPWLAGAVITGGILGPISLMTGLTMISGFSASLLLNLEGIATAVIAVFFFKEHAGRRLWLALTAMTIGGIFLTWDPNKGSFNITGSLLIVFAMICWGIDNNLTRCISHKDPVQIAGIKGFFAGMISILLALFIKVDMPSGVTTVLALLLGSFSYGISLVFFIKALSGLGAFRAGVFFSFAPFIGAMVSLILLKEWIGWVMFPATIFMAIGVWLTFNEKHLHFHEHDQLKHSHSHEHNDMHHLHEHLEESCKPQHIHEHEHSRINHSHVHWPDIHHRHNHY